jgi:hypothetical protein
MATEAEIRAIAEDQDRKAAAARKAAEEPSSLTEADLADLHPSVLAATMASGNLSHLGYGRSKKSIR